MNKDTRTPIKTWLLAVGLLVALAFLFSSNANAQDFTPEGIIRSQVYGPYQGPETPWVEKLPVPVQAEPIDDFHGLCIVQSLTKQSRQLEPWNAACHFEVLTNNSWRVVLQPAQPVEPLIVQRQWDYVRSTVKTGSNVKGFIQVQTFWGNVWIQPMEAGTRERLVKFQTVDVQVRYFISVRQMLDSNQEPVHGVYELVFESE